MRRAPTSSSRSRFDNLKSERVYKTVSICAAGWNVAMKLKQEIDLWLTASLSDPVATLLARNSNLTRTQLETLVIDTLAENLSGKHLKYDEKALLRPHKAKISRGSFNRTLKQAKENVVKSIYTILLLGYLGVFENTTLDPYLEVANKLHAYLHAYENMPSGGQELDNHAELIKTIREQLESTIKDLASRSKQHP